MTAPILRTEGLTKNFGAIFAVNSVSLEFMPGQVHAIIGPNGAGKTTLINLLSGDIQPSSGGIHFKGHDISRASADRVSRLGVGRSYQKTNIYPRFTCEQNCWLGAQSRLQSSMRFLRPASSYRQVRENTNRALELCGLGHRGEAIAGTLSHGEQRQLEIGMMLATAPEILLLDEPLAGMGSEEAVGVIGLLRELAKDHTLILIEHDMDAVFAIAEAMTVMVDGRVLASGPPDVIRNNADVQEAYLGTGDDQG
jgi:branched-chain amino acid transport system ATP-binding protein